MARVIQIGKRRWLAGMSWSSYEDKPSKAELKDDAERLNASWTCVRIGESAIQAGFCAPVANAKPGKVFSLAAMLADSREQPWLGIFKIDDGLWWYIAVRDGHAILPDGDIIGGEAEIHAARDRHSGFADWNYIDGDLSKLTEWLNDVQGKPTRVQSLASAGFPSMSLIITTSLLVSAAGGAYWWQQKMKAEERARIEALQRARAEQQAKATVQVVRAPSPLLSTPAPATWLDACGRVILETPLARSGWEMDGASCGASSATVLWVRRAGATVAERPDGTLSQDGEKVEQSIPLSGLAIEGVDDAIELDQALLLLRGWAQAADFRLVANIVPPPPPPQQRIPGANMVVPQEPVVIPPPQATVQLDVPISPFGLDFSSIPGLRFTSLKNGSSGSGWHLEGVLYGK